MIDTQQLSPAPFRSPLYSANTPRNGAEPSQPRLLIVDDEEAVRTALARFLRSKGYEVEVAESGPAALTILQRQRFVAMLCDIRMPDMTGLEGLPAAPRLD